MLCEVYTYKTIVCRQCLSYGIWQHSKKNQSMKHEIQKKKKIWVTVSFGIQNWLSLDHLRFCFGFSNY